MGMSPNAFKRLMRIYKWMLSDKIMAAQARKPTGFIGKYLVQPMFVHGNAALNESMLAELELTPTDCVLEVGFGPGALLSAMAVNVSDGRLHGLDFSPTMVSAASQRNQSHIDSGRLVLCEGCSDEMPYETAHFDKVVTGNTLYFWHPPQPHLNEILRVLKPGGRFVMGFRDQAQIDAMALDKDVFLRYTQADVVQLLEAAGFEHVHIKKSAAIPVDSYVAVGVKP